MKATDLRIGNIINDTSGEDLPITELIKRGQFWNVKVKGYSLAVDLDDCSPVEITEEWLLRFGFKKFQDEFYLRLPTDNFDWSIEYYNGEIAININDEYSNLTSAKYVHELQNLYHALTGKELK